MFTARAYKHGPFSFRGGWGWTVWCGEVGGVLVDTSNDLGQHYSTKEEALEGAKQYISNLEYEMTCK